MKGHPWKYTTSGVLFFSAIGLIVGLICGIGLTRHVYKEADKIEQIIKYKRSLDGLPIRLNGAEFNCRLRVGGMNDFHAMEGK